MVQNGSSCFLNLKLLMIKFSDPGYEFNYNLDEYIKIFSKVLISRKYILSDETSSFEKLFANFVGTKYAVGVNSATDGLTISLKLLNIGRGDEVITSPHTALATISAIINSGAKPVLIDINENDYCIDVTRIVDKINIRTKAIIPIHIYGHPANLLELKKISKKYKIPIVEDCSQAFGSMINKKQVGSFGDLSVFSFYPTKNLGGIGDGGIILTNSYKYFNQLKQLRQYGWDQSRNVKRIGFNSRLDEIQAAVLKFKLRKFKYFKSKRKKIADLYNLTITNKNIVKPSISVNYEHSFHLYVIRTKNRKKLINILNKNNIQSAIHYKNNIINDKIYSKYCKFNKNELAVFLKLNKEFLSLPMHVGLKEEEILFISDIINNYY